MRTHARNHHHVAICDSRLGVGIALAACASALPSLAADATTIELQYVPAGAFRPSDGREMTVPAWHIDAALAAAVIAEFNARKTPPVLDYEHQTLRKEENGQPAPAAGWFRSLAWREGEGLYATVELTGRAADYIRAGEYRYFSPVFRYDTSGAITQVLMGALTNHPAIDGMEPLTLQAAATFGAADISSQEKSTMNPLLAAIIAALSLGANATEEQAIAACAALAPKLNDLRQALGIAADAKPDAVVAGIAAATAQLDQLGKMRAALGIAADAAPATAIAACTALKAGSVGAPDPAKYVPIEAVTQLQTQVAALTAEHTDRKVSEVVEGALESGRLLPAMKDWAMELGRSNFAALTAYIDKAQPIAALTATQTGGRQPAAAADNELGLSADEIAVCTATGIAPKDFAAAKKA